jgi:hypothetical protein
MIIVKDYLKANEKHIIANWRKHEFIRAKHNFSICDYIAHYCWHISEQCKVNIECKELQEFAQRLYKIL